MELSAGMVGRGSVEEAGEERQDGFAAGVPLAEFADAGGEEAGVVRVGRGEELAEVGEPFGAAVEVRLEFFADEAGDEFFEFGFCGVVVAAVAGDVDWADGTDAAEDFEALAGGAFADGEAEDEGVEGEGERGAEEEAVDFADGFGEADEFDGGDEDVDDGGFHGGELRRSWEGFWGAGVRRGHGGDCGGGRRRVQEILNNLDDLGWVGGMMGRKKRGGEG